MPDPIPASDPALLAAQAKGGQAGVDAYNAAIASMQQQRAQAVQQAMQEAALRGAPVGAAQSLQSTITNPYDQGIAQLTQGNAAFQGDMAARNQRYQDYQGGVQAARSFIPLQTEQTLAPIRAENDFRLRTQQLAGDRAIGEIDADTKLQLARIAATRAAAEIAAKKKAAEDAAEKMKLNQGELAATLQDRAQSGLSAVASGAAPLVEQNSQQAWAKAVENLVRQAVQAKPTQDKLVNQSYWATQGARYMAQAAATYQPPKTGLAPKPGVPVSVPVGIPGMGGGSVTVQTDRNYQSEPDRQAADARERALSQVTSLEEQVARLAQTRTGYQSALLGQIGTQNRALTEPYKSYDNQGRLIGYITPQQLQAFSPFDQSILAGASQYGGLNKPADVRRLLIGEAGPDDRGVPSPYAATALRSYENQTGADLVNQGYDIGQPDIDAAIRSNIGQGVNLFDIESKQIGRPTNAGQYDMDVSDYKAAAAADRQATQDARQAASDQASLDKANYTQAQLQRAADYQTQYGVAPPSWAGTPDQTWNLVSSPEFLDAEAQVISERQQDSSADIDQILDSIAIANPGIRRMLKYLYPNSKAKG